MEKNLFFIIVISCAVSMFACNDDFTESSVENQENERNTTKGIISQEVAAEYLQNVLNALFESGDTRGESCPRTVNVSGVMSGCVPSTRGTEKEECIFYAIPFAEKGYSVVSASDGEILSIVPDGTITQKEVDRQISLSMIEIEEDNRIDRMEKEVFQKIVSNDSLLGLRNLLRKKLVIDEAETEEEGDGILDMGELLWSEKNGYTVWFDELGDTMLYTMGYNSDSENYYVATFYNIKDSITRLNGDTTLDFAFENKFIWRLNNMVDDCRLAENDERSNDIGDVLPDPVGVRVEDYIKQITGRITSFGNNNNLNFGIYNAILYSSKEDAVDDLKGMNLSNVSVDLHSTTCGIDGRKVLSYGIKQSVGMFASAFPNSYAGCGPVACAAIFMQKNVQPSVVHHQLGGWDSYTRSVSSYSSAGCSYYFTTNGQEAFSDFLWNIACQSHAICADDDGAITGTGVTRNNMGDFLKRYFNMYGTDVEYKESRVKKQIDRNCLEIVYGRSHGGLHGLFHQHYWVVSAYAIVKSGSRTSTLVYNNTSWNGQDGWYTMNNRLGYRHHGKLFEPGEPRNN